MISSFDYYKKIESPNMYLCNPDKKPICALNAENRHLVLRFNDLSELTFTIPKLADTEEYFALIEAKRLIFVEKIGWFIIESAYETITGNNCSKEVTARSHQYALKNRGFVTEERVYMFYNPNDPLDEKYDSKNKGAMPSVIGQLYRQAGIRIELTGSDIEPSEDKGEWTIIYIDPILYFQSRSYSGMYEPREGYENICRSFEANENLNGYDFIINNVENSFEVIFEFDFFHHTIKVKTLDDITQPTDIYLSFDNIVKSLNVKENAEDIVTVMSCNGGNLDIRTVNPMGTNFIVDFSYYKKRVSDNGQIEYPWMSERLINALDEWEELFDTEQAKYTKLVADLQKKYLKQAEIGEQLRYSNLKLTDMQVARDQFINKDDKSLDGGGTITAETIKANHKSIKKCSRFYADPFNEDSVIVGYISEPTMTKGEAGIFTFAFSESGKSGTANSLIQDYYDEESDFDGVQVPLYFMDEDDRSFCKLKIESVVEIAKDGKGVPINFSYETGTIWHAKSGIIEIDGVKFNILKATITGNYNISCGNFSLDFESNAYFVYNGNRYRVVASPDGIVSLYRYYVSGFDRFTTYRETTGSSGWCSLWEEHINKTLTPKLNEIKAQTQKLKSEMDKIAEQCNVQRFIKSKGEDLYDELNNYWIEGEYSNDSIATHDSTTISERIELAKELMKAGKKNLEKCAQPKFEMTVDAINFIKLYEFRQFTYELALGKTITIEKSDGMHYCPALMSIEFDMDTSESFTMQFSNASKLGETSMTFADLIKESSTTSRTVAANWANITDYTRNKEQINRLIEAPLDRSLRTMREGFAAQAFVIDENGILGRKYDKAFDAANGTFSPEQIRIVNNTIVFTKDNWETAALALGKTDYGYGLVADVLVGEVMLGEQISIGSKSERVRINDQGLLIKNDNGDAVFQADADGNITLRGTVYATAGEFSGIIHASAGEFNGTITAERGEIGGYTIGKDALVGKNVGMRSNRGASASQNGTNDIAFWAGSAYATSAPFRVNSNGDVVATNGSIGNLGLGNGSLFSDNFRLETIKQGTASASWLRFYDSNGNETTTISDTDVSTSNINASNSIQGGEIYAGTLHIGDGLRISGKAISGNATYIQLDGEGEVTTYNASLSWSKSGPWEAWLKVTLDKPLRYAKTFTIKYDVKGGLGRATKNINIPLGGTEGSVLVGCVIGMEVIFFESSRSTSYSFTQSAGVPEVRMLGSLIPAEHCKYELGTPDKEWNNIYAQNSQIRSSDANLKNNIQDIKMAYSEMFDKLRPVTYKFNDNTSGRDHMGLIAQEFKEAIESSGLTTQEVAAYCEWVREDGSIGCGIRYGELIPLLISEVQNLKMKINSLSGGEELR